MSERRTDSIDSNYIKKSDKLPPESYREYLDMHTDDEDLGRQETPKPDEEFPVESEKLIFSDKNLQILMQYVKNLTIIPNLEELDISDENIEIIQEYFQNPSHTILTIFYEKSQYRALLDFPYFTKYGLIYFLRPPWQIYTVDNFLSTVLFGNFNSDVKNSTLKFMENIYSPIAIDSIKWPIVTKEQVFSTLNEFLINLTHTTYQLMGITIFYIPKERIPSYHHNEHDNSVVERLERVARHWIKQFRRVLCGINTRSKSSFITLHDEIQWWNYRSESLLCLKCQLLSQSVITIIQTLEKIKSSSTYNFYSLVDNMNVLINEATSNITYLNLLVNYCCDMKMPDEIDDYVIKVLMLIRFIGINSEFYNTIDKIEMLCQTFGTQIIIQCQKNIDLEIILEKEPILGQNILQNCIDSCRIFLQIFDQVVIMDQSSDSKIFSKMNDKNVFCYVNTFIQRCQDLIEIIDARIAFHDYKAVNIIGGVQALGHEPRYRKIEELFEEMLKRIKHNCHHVLNISEVTWLEQISNFHRQIENVNNMINNLIHDVFNNVSNVEEGLEALYSITRFIRRKNLQNTLKYYWILIWNLFDDELKTVIIDNYDETIRTNTMKSLSIDEVAYSQMKRKYLERQYNMLIDASDWFDSDIPILIMKKYERIQAFLIQNN